MLFLFRKIRKALMQKNKTTTYLLYAVGEIVLVVIGILIALSINNYSQSLKDRAKEQEILIQLKDEYQRNLVQLDQKIFMREQGIESALYVMGIIDEPNMLDQEQFYKALWHITVDPTFDPIKNDIIGSGNLRLIQNNSLVKLLSNWSTEVYQVQELENIHVKFRTEVCMPIFNRLRLSRNIASAVWINGYSPIEALDKNSAGQLDISPTKVKLDYSEILSDAELEGAISLTATIHKNANLQSQALRTRIMQILDIIENEIDK